jgi:hypothetical protein
MQPKHFKKNIQTQQINNDRLGVKQLTGEDYFCFFVRFDVTVEVQALSNATADVMDATCAIHGLVSSSFVLYGTVRY